MSHLPSDFIITKIAEPLVVKKWVLAAPKETRHEVCNNILRALYQTRRGEFVATLQFMVTHPLIKFQPTYEELKHVATLPIGQSDLAKYLLTSPDLHHHLPVRGEHSVLQQAIRSGALDVVTTALAVPSPPDYQTFMRVLPQCLPISVYDRQNKNYKGIFDALVDHMMNHHRPEQPVLDDMVQLVVKHLAASGFEWIIEKFGVEHSIQALMRCADKNAPTLLAVVEKQPSWHNHVAELLSQDEQWVERSQTSAPTLHALSQSMLLKKHTKLGASSVKKKM